MTLSATSSSFSEMNKETTIMVVPNIKIGDSVIYVDCAGNKLIADVVEVHSTTPIKPQFTDLAYTTPHGRNRWIRTWVNHLSDKDRTGKNNFWYRPEDGLEEVAKKFIKKDWTEEQRIHLT